MGSKADFYVGRGIDSDWLGSILWEGLPVGLPRKMLTTTTEETFRNEVDHLLTIRGDGVFACEGWPWPWETSHGTKYTYAYDPKVNCVMASCYGSSWWEASKEEPDHTTLKRKAAIFPDMAMVKKGGGGVFDADAAPKKKKKKRTRS